jgi:hypothetical protein
MKNYRIKKVVLTGTSYYIRIRYYPQKKILGFWWINMCGDDYFCVESDAELFISNSIKKYFPDKKIVEYIELK